MDYSPTLSIFCLCFLSLHSQPHQKPPTLLPLQQVGSHGRLEGACRSRLTRDTLHNCIDSSSTLLPHFFHIFFHTSFVKTKKPDKRLVFNSAIVSSSSTFVQDHNDAVEIRKCSGVSACAIEGGFYVASMARRTPDLEAQRLTPPTILIGSKGSCSRSLGVSVK